MRIRQWEHQNLSSYATDEAKLYEIWQRDLSRQATKEALRTLPGFILIGLFLYGYAEKGFLIAGLMLVYLGLRCFIDASNVNYLLHRFDYEDAVAEFRRRASIAPPK